MAKAPAVAFSGFNCHRVIGAIHNMATRISNMAKPTFTLEELSELFIPPPLQVYLRVAYEAVQPLYQQDLRVSLGNRRIEGHETAVSAINTAVRFTWSYDKSPSAFFVPHGLQTIQETASPELVEKFNDATNRMLRVSYEWGLVQWVFRSLNQPGYCSTPQQMRYIWPSILPILTQVAGYTPLVKELQVESARAGDKARAPTEVQPYLRTSYDIVTRAILLLENEASPRGGVFYSLESMLFELPEGLQIGGM